VAADKDGRRFGTLQCGAVVIVNCTQILQKRQNKKPKNGSDVVTTARDLKDKENMTCGGVVAMDDMVEPKPFSPPSLSSLERGWYSTRCFVMIGWVIGLLVVRIIAWECREMPWSWS